MLRIGLRACLCYSSVLFSYKCVPWYEIYFVMQEPKYYFVKLWWNVWIVWRNEVLIYVSLFIVSTCRTIGFILKMKINILISKIFYISQYHHRYLTPLYMCTTEWQCTQCSSVQQHRLLGSVHLDCAGSWRCLASQYSKAGAHSTGERGHHRGPAWL